MEPVKGFDRIPHSLDHANSIFMEKYKMDMETLGFISDEATRNLYINEAVKVRSSPLAMFFADCAAIGTICGRSGILFKGMYLKYYFFAW